MYERIMSNRVEVCRCVKFKLHDLPRNTPKARNTDSSGDAATD